MGIEPTIVSFKEKCLNLLTITNICCERLMEQVTGFEPVSSAWQAEILTIILYLHGISGTEAGPVPPKCDLCQRVEPATGIEPATY